MRYAPRSGGFVARCADARRGVRCSPEQVVITAGAQHAMDLLLRVIGRPGEDDQLISRDGSAVVQGRLL